MLNSLIKLQSLDNKLQALEALKGDLPQQIKALKDELQAVKEQFDRETELLNEIRKSKLHYESDLKVFEDKLNKYREQLYAVTSNKEYDAITLEIDTMKEKISETETKILELIEDEEQRAEEVEGLGEQVKMLEANLGGKEKELNAKIQATEEESLSYMNRRQELVSQIQRPILYQYERIRKGLGNNAVAEIRNYACGGCFSTIPPQKVVEIKMMNQLILCESCGRILVYKNQEETVHN